MEQTQIWYRNQTAVHRYKVPLILLGIALLFSLSDNEVFEFIGQCFLLVGALRAVGVYAVNDRIEMLQDKLAELEEHIVRLEGHVTNTLAREKESDRLDELN